MGTGIPVHLDPYRYTVPRQPVSVHSVLPLGTASPILHIRCQDKIRGIGPEMGQHPQCPLSPIENPGEMDWPHRQNALQQPAEIAAV